MRQHSKVQEWLRLSTAIGWYAVAGRFCGREWEVQRLQRLAMQQPTLAQMVSGRLATIHEKNGDIDAAIRAMEASPPGITDEPGFYYFELGEMKRRAGDRAGTLLCYNRALSHPGSLSPAFLSYVEERRSTLI
jgi:hypothetical protein